MDANISAKTVWATISLNDQRKLVVGSYYRPPDSGSDSIEDFESVLSFITEKFLNNSQCTIILGGDFNAGDIDWESHTVCEHSLNRQINENILSVIRGRASRWPEATQTAVGLAKAIFWLALLASHNFVQALTLFFY